MRIKLISLGQKTPSWIKEGLDEYMQRIPCEFNFQLVEFPLKNHGKLPTEQAKIAEGKILLNALHPQDFCISLDEHGKELTTQVLSQKLQHWQNEAQNISILIGGPAGLSKECLEHADFIWSLSQLTFPHQMVKLIITEQVYRAISILKGHPYHRE
jgi:23S rRNA (pseudouridine1915-N3)-methyltransferase